MSEMLEGYVLGQDGNRNNGMWGDGGAFWIVLILLFMFGGWGNGGFFGGNRGNCATTSDLADSFNFNQLDNGIRGIQQGICDATFSLNNTMQAGFTGVQSSLCNGFNSTNQAINNLGFQMQNCCCDLKSNIKDVAFQIERSTCNIIEAGHANTQRIVDMMTQNTIQELRDRASAYELQLSQQAQTANLLSNLNPTPRPAYITCSPYESVMMNWRGFNGGCGSYNNGCGCGCGCN